MSTKLIPYLRKSSKEDPAVSRDRQHRAIEAWASQHNVTLGPEVWEPGVSGSKHWRERGLGEAVAACERGEAAGIIVEEQSRLSRGNQLQTAEVWDAFQKAGLRLVCVADGIDTANGDHELNFGVRALLAREQWKQYARRMEHAKVATIARGCHISGTVPFGYRRVESGLVIDGQQAPVVCELFRRRAAGESIGGLSRWLATVAPDGPSGKGWVKQTIQGILRNRAYLGEARQGAHSKAGAHDAIIDETVFSAVQARARRPEANNSPKSSPALLAGLVRCARCGYAMSRAKVNGYWVYRHRSGSSCPEQSLIVMENLDRFVVDAALDYVDGILEAEAIDPSEERAALVARRDALVLERVPYQDREFVKTFGAEATLTALNAIDAELAELDEALSRLRGDRPSFPDRITWKNLSVEEQHDVLADLVRDVLVSRAPRGTGVADRVRIVWFDEDSGLARPSRGRAEVVAGVAAA